MQNAATVTIGSGNRFGGDNFYIDNQAASSYDLTVNVTTYDLAGPFRIEDHIYH